MKIADFLGELSPEGLIAVPPDIASQVPRGERIQVVLQWGVSDEAAAWRILGQQGFESAYAEEDSVYESLIDEPPTR